MSWRGSAIQGATSSKLTSEDRRPMRQLTGGLDHRSELEQRMAPSLGKVLLGLFIDADADPPQNRDGWPHARPEQHAKQPRAPVRLEGAPNDGCRLFGRELDGLHRDATAVIGHDRLAGRLQVSNPAALAVGRLDKG